MGTLPGDVLTPEVNSNSHISVKLIGIESRSPLEAELSIGKNIGEGESGIVREAEVVFKKDNKTRKYPVAIKTYIGQDKSRISGIPSEVSNEAYNEGYKMQLIYYRILKRIGANVIPTFRIARNVEGNDIGIVMTNLALNSLDTKSEVITVTSTKTDLNGSRISYMERSKDRILAKRIGLELDKDSWMLQYSNKWNGLGKLIPSSVISDIIGIKISDKRLLSEFLKRKGNEDIYQEVNMHPLFRIQIG
ncbi:MAG: hypothetical protein WCO33_01260 [bacterium]